MTHRPNKCVVLVLLLAMAAQPAAASVALMRADGLRTEQPRPNPCEDALYLGLKAKNLNEMTDREYEYSMLKERECGDYQRAVGSGESPSSSAPLLTPQAEPGIPEVRKGSADAEPCEVLGRTRGHKAKADAFTGGFCAGLLLGPLGTVIVRDMQDGEEPRLGDYPPDMADGTCRLAFSQGFRDETRRKKKSSALIGGITGTMVSVIAAVIVLSQD